MIFPIKTAIVGFGLSGKYFHAPFIQAHEGFRLSAFVTSGDEAPVLYPDAKIFRSFDELLNDRQIELVVIATPNQLHFSQAMQALKAGKHVVVEKPVAGTFVESAELMLKAVEQRKMLFPYQNRRWDGDFLTVKHLITNGLLGNVLEYHARFDRFNPTISRASWRYDNPSAGGTLYDLGIHLVDQAVNLFGRPQAVFCRLFNCRENSLANDSFDLKLIYPSTDVTLHASVSAREPGPKFIVHGTKASFVKYGADPQEADLQAGKTPGKPGWGAENPENYGILTTGDAGNLKRDAFPTLPGNYMAFYDDVFQCITSDKVPEVKPQDAFLNMLILESAIESHRSQSVIQISSKI